MDTQHEKVLSREELMALVIDLRREIAVLRRRVAELEGGRTAKQVPEAFSLQAEERRRDQARGRKRKQKSVRRGRQATQQKVDDSDRLECVVPEGLTLEQCTFVRARPVWRVEGGRAVRVTYELYRGPNGNTAPIEGVLPRSEFGLEIHVSVAFLVFLVGLSIEKVCRLVKFFWNLDLSKSQADALLNQLSKHWERDFEALCRLLAVSAVVHAFLQHAPVSPCLTGGSSFRDRLSSVTATTAKESGHCTETGLRYLTRKSTASVGRG